MVMPEDVAEEIAALFADRPRPGFPYRLAVRRMRGVINTAYHDLAGNQKRQTYNPAYMNGDDLAALGLGEGDAVTVVSAHGRIPAMVALDDTLRRGVVSMTHGWGNVLPDERGDYMKNGSSTSRLISSDQDCQTINAMAQLTGIPISRLRRCGALPRLAPTNTGNRMRSFNPHCRPTYPNRRATDQKERGMQSKSATVGSDQKASRTAVIDGAVPDHVPAALVRDFNAYDFSRPNEELQRTLYELTRDPDMPETFWSPYNGGHWVVTRALTVETVISDAERFSNRYIGLPKALNPTRLYRPFQMDPPHVAPYRSLISRAISPRAIDILATDARELTIRLIEEFKPKGQCEFVSEFAEHMPIGIFMSIVGLPEVDRPAILAIARKIGRPTFPEERMIGYAELDEYNARLIEARRDNGPDDFVSYLCQSEVEGKTLDTDELVGVLGLIMIAGLDTVAGILGHVARFLALNPDRRKELRDVPAIHRSAVEEFLRRLSHVQLSREVREDLELDGVQMKQGDMVVAPLLLYNLDEQKYADPLAFDFRRSRTPAHVAFGGPTHRCLGAMLARTELHIFLKEFLDRIPDFEIAPGAEPTASTRVTWVMNTLPLKWNVA